MRPFDPKTYLTEVLAPCVESAELPNLFDRYLLDVEDADETAIEARLEEVKRCWDKKSEHAKYGATVRSLIDKHSEAKLALVDPRGREQLADKVRKQMREREEASTRAVQEWDELLEQMIRSAGGLEPAQRARLEKMAATTGIAGPAVQAKLDAAPVAAEPEVLDQSQRTVIAQSLTNLARDLGEPRVGLSLFHAFGLELTDDRETIEARHQEEVQANRLRSHGNTKASWDSVLSLARIHLLENDTRAYVHGLMLDVREALELRAMKAAADDGAIDEVEAEQLLREALALGLTSELAQRVVAELAREYGAGLRTGAAVDFVACPSCNNPHPRDAGDERCRRCGTPLFVYCPNDCSWRNDATAARCSKCGTDLHRYTAAIRAVARLPELVDEGRVGRARDELDDAIAVLGRSHAEVESASRRVTAAVEAAKRGWAEVDAARAERRHYAARRLLAELERKAKDFPGPTGEPPAKALETSRERVAEAETALARARGLQGEARERTLTEALHLAADCVEAERELDKMPLQAPSGVEATATGAVMTVRWAASPTSGVRYLVRRDEDGRSGAVGEVDGLEIADSGARHGAVLRYQVEAVRGRARSPVAVSPPVIVALEVSDLSASGGDGEVRLSWAARGGAGRVVVTRRDEVDRSETPIASDSGGVTDRSVLNGRRYTYLVCVEYPGPAGKLVRTPGLTAFAEPVERPKPLRELSVQAGPAGVALGFEQPENGTVSVFRCPEDPELELGAELDPASLAALGQALTVSGSSAADPTPPAGRCFYQAVTVAGGLAIAGVAVRHVALPEIANVRAVANGRQAQVTWTWPDGVTLARVVWRHDRQPAGPGDADSQAIDYRLGEYRDRGGCPLDLGEQRSLFVSVYPAARIGGEIACGSGGGRGTRATLRTKSRTELRYSVRRSGMLQKRLEVEVSEPPTGSLPELVLVGREGEILPRTATDGAVLARLGGDGPRSSSLELRGLSRPLAIRLFLDSASAASSFVLFDPMADQLLID
ncbi:MAG TPA: zinc ribbon domain-containing protein [Solirubrobacterales bacterium]|nr:zinc ribbon domain-containing protein [Solirubrobacterales bacterium]